MAFELREGQMFIFKNEHAVEGKNHPTHTGNLKVGGKEYRVSCWIKEGKNGRFFSCSVKDKEETFNAGSEPYTTSGPKKNVEGVDDDIAF